MRPDLTCIRGQGAAFSCRVLIAAAIVFCGCSPQKMMIRQFTALVEDGSSAFEQDDDLEMLESAFPANIKLLEALLVNDPQNRPLLVLLARFYGSYAFLFLEGDIEAAQLLQRQSGAPTGAASEQALAAVKYYRKGLAYALRALEVRYADAGKQLANVVASGPFVQSLASEDVPALFWYGFNLSGIVNHSRGDVGAVARAHLVEKSMRRVIAVDPTYYYGSAHLVLIAYYGERSPMMGGNPQRAQAHYRRLKDMQGEYFLLADLFYARYYLVQTRRPALFDQVLSGIVEHRGQSRTYPLFNRIAADRAALYLEHRDKFFE
jgi:hypothetical protein